MQSGYDIGHLVQEAQTRWLKPPEVLFILQNHESHRITQEPPQKPQSGSIFLFNKRVLRFFRKDGHSWRERRMEELLGKHMNGLRFFL
ncbi:Calmodulin-binding transcription activator 4 [Ancistrocladus abbreviatus]